MDYRFYWDLLRKRLWLILAVALISAVAAYWFTSRQKPNYVAKSLMETGINDYKENAFIQEAAIKSGFEILINNIMSSRMLRLLSFELLIHELEGNEPAFRSPEVEVPNISPGDEEELVRLLKEMVDTLSSGIHDPVYDDLYTNFAKAYRYTEKDLSSKLTTERVGGTDQVRITFTSENPALSAFAVRRHLKHVIDDHGRSTTRDVQSRVQRNTILRDQKRNQLDSINFAIASYKKSQSLGNIDEQNKSYVSQIRELEIQREEARQNIESSKLDLADLRAHLAEKNQSEEFRQYQKRNLQEELTALNEEIALLNNQWIASGQKDKNILIRLNEKKRRREALTQSKSTSVLVEKQSQQDNQYDELFRKELNAKQRLNQAETSYSYLESEIARLRGNVSLLAIDQSNLEKLALEQEQLGQEYNKINDELNEAELDLQTSFNPYRITEYPSKPRLPESNNALVISIFTGLGAGALSAFAVFLVAFLDSRLSSPHQFRAMTKLPLIASLNYVKPSVLNTNDFISDSVASKYPAIAKYRENLRKLRYQVEESNEHVFLLTSTREGEGKTTTIIHLAQLLAAGGKNVLIVDTNFRNNRLTKLVEPRPYRFGLILQELITDYNLEEIFFKKEIMPTDDFSPRVDFLGSDKQHITPLEAFWNSDASKFIRELSDIYDIILFEGPSLNEYADSKELADWSNAVISIFSSNTSLNQSDRESIDYLVSLDKKYLGSVLNGVDIKNIN